jgi:hypothetical protein
MSGREKGARRRKPGRRAWLAIGAAACCAALASGVAYATIPGSGGGYTACVLKNVGTIRLIDPTLPPSQLMSHCTSLEKQVGWSRQGQAGPTGPAGEVGATGAAGVQGVAGPAGDRGAAGATGPQGPPGTTGAQGSRGNAGPQGGSGPPGDFSGEYSSPNDEYRLSVTDGGIELRGPSGRVSLTGGLTISSVGTLSLSALQIRLNGCVAPLALVSGSTLGGVLGIDPFGNPIYGGVATIMPPGAATVCAG